MSLIYKNDGVYQDDRTGNFYFRPVVAGRRTCRKLASTTLTMARKEVAALRTRQIEARLGLGQDPFAESVTVGHLAEAWLNAGCPDRKGIPRGDVGLKPEQQRLARALKYWSAQAANLVNAKTCRAYHDWRTKHSKKRFRLARSVDAELTTISNVLWWAVDEERLKANPLAQRPRFDNPRLVRHCTAVMPMTDDALHRLAAYLFASDRSRPLGWQMLLEAFTGARTSEILACRTDAAELPNGGGQAGFQTATALFIERKKQGIKPWALLQAVPGHAPLADLLAAFHHWHKKRYPHTPWFIPGRDAQKPMSPLALTRALRRGCKELEMPLVTSHGLRAYFVRALRSLGVDDSEIAKRLGHRSGVELVEKTYGISEPGWFGGKEMDFLPAEGKPAWAQWSPPVSRKIVAVKFSGNPHTRTNQKSRNRTKQAAVGEAQIAQ